MKKGTLFAIGVIGGFVLLVLIVASLIPALSTKEEGGPSRRAIMRRMLSHLRTALADYHRDHGIYPPDRGDGDMDKCSEALYFYLSGADVDAANVQLREQLKSSRRDAKAYFLFREEYLKDYDGDGYWEIVDAWGQPWLYVVAGGARQPFHHPGAYDLYSVGPDGKTGGTWKSTRDMFALPADDPASFYRQASDEPEDGDASSGADYSQDDISNF